jgi:hypothetical protein
VPKKLGRRTAGERVQALAQAFADDLLQDEERAFTRIGLVFLQPIPHARTELRAVWNRHRQDPARTAADVPYQEALDRTHRAAAAATVDIVTELGQTAISKGLAAVEQELAVCEQTLPTRYRGVAALAVQGATEAGVKILAQATAAYSADASASAGEFAARARLQLGQAKDLDEMLARLFSEQPAGLEGFGGRGVWWWTVSDLNAAARAVSIRCANLARLSAMQTFNEVADGR